MEWQYEQIYKVFTCGAEIIIQNYIVDELNAEDLEERLKTLVNWLIITIKNLKEVEKKCNAKRTEKVQNENLRQNRKGNY